MTDAEVKQAIERYGLKVGCATVFGIEACYARGTRKRDGLQITVWKVLMAEAVAEVVRQIEEKSND